MKTKLFFIVIIFVLVCACKSQAEREKTPFAKNCMELKLVTGEVVKDTFCLYEGTILRIGQYKGAYGLKILNYSPLYHNRAYALTAPFIRWGVIDYKITNVIKQY